MVEVIVNELKCMKLCRQTFRSCWTCYKVRSSWVGMSTHISLMRTRICSSFSRRRTAPRSCFITWATWWWTGRWLHSRPHWSLPRSRQLCRQSLQVSVNVHLSVEDVKSMVTAKCSETAVMLLLVLFISSSNSGLLFTPLYSYHYFQLLLDCTAALGRCGCRWSCVVYHLVCLVCLSVYLRVSPAKMAEPIEMPCGMWTLVGPRNYRKGHFWGRLRQDFPACHLALFPVALTSGFLCMLLNSIMISQPQKQSNVALNFLNEKSPCNVASPKNSLQHVASY